MDPAPPSGGRANLAGMLLEDLQQGSSSSAEGAEPCFAGHQNCLHGSGLTPAGLRRKESSEELGCGASLAAAAGRVASAPLAGRQPLEALRVASLRLDPNKIPGMSGKRKLRHAIPVVNDLLTPPLPCSAAGAGSRRRAARRCSDETRSVGWFTGAYPQSTSVSLAD